ncbi:hypothetical protein FNYG_06652 [Fusarium nygamai]|uniref:Uncharacterized protein n=1 Tax=Gibberella nygamai TaxID=42673 RepID=A0A2K0WCE3_GIBNY|nr:hypothetical protein FNYG_06652 [Fusarium nygamai]
MGNAQSLLNLVADRWPLLATALLACFVVAVAPRVLNLLPLWSIPTIGEELGNKEKRRQAYLGGARNLYSAGYQKFKDCVFLITTSRTSPTIVISPDFLPELKKLPDATLSMEALLTYLTISIVNEDQMHQDRDISTHNSAYYQRRTDSIFM